MSRKVLDYKGIACPKPIIRISQEVKRMSPGDEIEVDATDPNFSRDRKNPDTFSLRKERRLPDGYRAGDDIQRG